MLINCFEKLQTVAVSFSALLEQRMNVKGCFAALQELKLTQPQSKTFKTKHDAKSGKGMNHRAAVPPPPLLLYLGQLQQLRVYITAPAAVS